MFVYVHVQVIDIDPGKHACLYMYMYKSLI